MASTHFLSWCYRTSSNTTNISNLRVTELEEMPIPLPSLPEQRRIAAMLEEADRLRRARRYALELSDTVLPAAFLEMFGDPSSSSFKFPKRALVELCTQITDGTHITPTYLSEGVPFLSVKNVNTASGELDFADVRFISNEAHAILCKACRPERGDILYTKVGATFGIPKLVDVDHKFSIFVSLALLKPDSSTIDPLYLARVLGLDYVLSQARRLVSGIAVPDLHLREIRTFMIPVPPLPLQQRFADLVRGHEQLRAAQRESLRQAEHLFQSLLMKVFGEGL